MDLMPLITSPDAAALPANPVEGSDGLDPGPLGRQPFKAILEHVQGINGEPSKGLDGQLGETAYKIAQLAKDAHKEAILRGEGLARLLAGLQDCNVGELPESVRDLADQLADLLQSEDGTGTEQAILALFHLVTQGQEQAANTDGTPGIEDISQDIDLAVKKRILSGGFQKGAENHAPAGGPGKDLPTDLFPEAKKNLEQTGQQGPLLISQQALQEAPSNGNQHVVGEEGAAQARPELLIQGGALSQGQKRPSPKGSPDTQIARTHYREQPSQDLTLDLSGKDEAALSERAMKELQAQTARSAQGAQGEAQRTESDKRPLQAVLAASQNDDATLRRKNVRMQTQGTEDKAEVQGQDARTKSSPMETAKLDNQSGEEPMDEFQHSLQGQNGNQTGTRAVAPHGVPAHQHSQANSTQAAGQASQAGQGTGLDTRTQVSVLSQLRDTMLGTIRMNNTKAVLQLSPPELGSVRIEIVVQHHSEIHASFLADTPEAKHIIQNGLGDLREHLSSSGFQLCSCDVDVSGRQQDGQTMANWREGSSQWEGTNRPLESRGEPEGASRSQRLGHEQGMHIVV